MSTFLCLTGPAVKSVKFRPHRGPPARSVKSPVKSGAPSGPYSQTMLDGHPAGVAEPQHGGATDNLVRAA